jgi:hypothetical protein
MLINARQRFLVCLLLPFTPTVSAQSLPKIEFFEGYSFFHGEQLSSPLPTTGFQFFRPPIERPPDSLSNPPPPITQRRFDGVNMFGTVVGGSIDYRITDRLLRIATGVVSTRGGLPSPNSDTRRFSFDVMGGKA